jgi:regulator of sigma E protease
MLAILAPILVFGLVIFVHELGHFLAAKATGVYAPRFSIGFGPAIFKFRWRETQYILACLPLGGYVRMASRHDAETAFLEGGNEEAPAEAKRGPDFDPEAMVPFGPKPVPENRWFESKSLAARLLIMVAGVTMNVLLAIVVATVLALHYGQVIYPSTVVGSVKAMAAAPALAQLQPGDTIRAVNGAAVHSWNDVYKDILISGAAVDFATQRGTVRVPLGQPGATPDSVANALMYAWPPVIDSIVPGDRAAAAGLRSGDSIVSVGGRRLVSWTQMVDLVSAAPNRATTFVVSRGGLLDTLTVTPKPVVQVDSATGAHSTVGRIGAATKQPGVVQSYGLIAAMGMGVRITWDNAGAVFTVLHQIGTGQVSVHELGGPIAITKASVTAARSGLDDLFYLIALLSINVAVLNLLPIPIFDGGQILINVLEAVKGSPFSMRTREYLLRFGLVAIALLLALVMYNDTRGWFAGLAGWAGKLFGA